VGAWKRAEIGKLDAAIRRLQEDVERRRETLEWMIGRQQQQQQFALF
jgi:hypothetical protein